MKVKFDQTIQRGTSKTDEEHVDDAKIENKTKNTRESQRKQLSNNDETDWRRMMQKRRHKSSLL